MNPQLQPVLEGARLKLRPLRADDFEALYLAASDPLIWELHPEPTRYLRDVFEAYFNSGIESKGAFLISDRASGEIAGSSRYYNWNPEERSIYVGYTFLTRKNWGGEVNRELKALMLDHAFGFAEKVKFQVGEKNFRSRRALEKIGAWLVEDSRPNAVYEIDRTSALKARNEARAKH